MWDLVGNPEDRFSQNEAYMHVFCSSAVIPRQLWLRPDMTEKLFTGTFSKNETKCSSAKIIPFKIVNVGGTVHVLC